MIQVALIYCLYCLLINATIQNFIIIIVLETAGIYACYHFNKINFPSVVCLSIFLDIIHLSTPGIRIFGIVCGMIFVRKLVAASSNDIFAFYLRLASFVLSCGCATWFILSI